MPPTRVLSFTFSLDVLIRELVMYWFLRVTGTNPGRTEVIRPGVRLQHYLQCYIDSIKYYFHYYSKTDQYLI